MPIFVLFVIAGVLFDSAFFPVSILKTIYVYFGFAGQIYAHAY